MSGYNFPDDTGVDIGRMGAARVPERRHPSDGLPPISFDGDAMVWIPACPLPMRGLFSARCFCGKGFYFRNGLKRYELHWYTVHEPMERAAKSGAQAGMTVARATRIYAAVAERNWRVLP